MNSVDGTHFLSMVLKQHQWPSAFTGCHANQLCHSFDFCFIYCSPCGESRIRTYGAVTPPRLAIEPFKPLRHLTYISSTSTRVYTSLHSFPQTPQAMFCQALALSEWNLLQSISFDPQYGHVLPALAMYFFFIILVSFIPILLPVYQMFLVNNQHISGWYTYLCLDHR